jgi:hypothetical protein
MARAYRLTPARRAALRKAQQASARKRKGHGARPQSRNHARKQRRRRVARNVALTGVAVGLGLAGVGYHQGERATVNRGVRKSIHKKGLGYSSANRAARITHGKRVRPLVTHNVRRQKAAKRAKRKARR